MFEEINGSPNFPRTSEWERDESSNFPLTTEWQRERGSRIQQAKAIFEKKYDIAYTLLYCNI